jgi:hypothetical protein
LLAILLEELAVDDRFVELFGPCEQVPLERAPQAIVIALALRNSWSRADFFSITSRLGVPLPANVFEPAPQQGGGARNDVCAAERAREAVVRSGSRKRR